MSMAADSAKLQLALDGETDIVIRRDFTHPPSCVWRALTDPALIPQWLGAMKRCEMDLRPGGAFHYEWDEFFFSGPILAVDAPHHMTHVEYFNGDTASGATHTTDLAAQGNGTRMTMVMRWANAEARAAAIALGMTDGLDEAYDKLETLLSAAPMDARIEGEAAMENRTIVERKSELELVVTRTFNAPARIVFEAWTKPELFKLWWVPKSSGMSLLSCEMDVREGGRYRLEFAHPAFEQPMAFFGKYIEVTPNSRLAWTNDEGGEGGPVTTVTFEERGGETLVVLRDLYPSKDALDAAIASDSTGGFGEQFEQLDALLVSSS